MSDKKKETKEPVVAGTEANKERKRPLSKPGMITAEGLIGTPKIYSPRGGI